MALPDALERVEKVYAAEGRHATPAEVVAQALGYKTATNGAAAQAIASLRYYGLVERPKEGHLAVTKDFEDYKFNPDEAQKQALLIGWLRTPQIFATLLDKYSGRLPSDANLRYDFISLGFIPNGADAYVGVFRRSVEFARYYEQPVQRLDSDHGQAMSEREPVEVDEIPRDPQLPPHNWIEASYQGRMQPVRQPTGAAGGGSATHVASANAVLAQQAAALGFAGGGPAMPIPEANPDVIRVPIRLPKGRCAWLELPIPFYESDKARLKAMIDMQLADDADEE
ncbi:hypothetical protein CYJ10_19100 [Cupriavidus pauculus]|uniref:Uncharacterized protein n=2 Tax=Cupriavidus pauculus TaxID=82633 RepID=A0A2N5C9L2_9BURK|nr:hypothetical protein CYJ10_19100 [Cupriavidus pauculus]